MEPRLLEFEMNVIRRPSAEMNGELAPKLPAMFMNWDNGLMVGVAHTTVPLLRQVSAKKISGSSVPDVNVTPAFCNKLLSLEANATNRPSLEIDGLVFAGFRFVVVTGALAREINVVEGVQDPVAPTQVSRS